MTIGSMFGDIIRSLFKRPATEKYPFVKFPAPKQFRGKLIWDPEKCTGCQLCVKDCPANAIELIVLDRAAKKFVFRYHIDACIYCGQCEKNCRSQCLELSSEEWELAAQNRQVFEVYYGKDEDVKFLLDKAARGEPDKPCEEPE